MPKLGVQKTKKIELPSFKGTKDPAWAEVITEIPIGWIQDIQDKTSDSDKTIALLVHVIKDWNFTDADGKKSVINEDNVKQLNITDLTAITGALGIDQQGLKGAQKKS
jgi:hypothetical protein